MQSLSKYNKGIKYLLSAIDLFSKYAWVVPLKDKKRITIVNAVQKIISKGGEADSKERRKSNEFLKINNIEMYSTYNEGKSVLAEKLLGPGKTKFLST